MEKFNIKKSYNLYNKLFGSMYTYVLRVVKIFLTHKENSIIPK